LPAGPSAQQRLDPYALPVRFTAPDAVADGRVRHVEIDRGGVRVRRSVHGMAINVSLPVHVFLGVALRLEPTDTERAGGLIVSLEHRDPALSLPLFAAEDNLDIIAEWRLWGRILGVPLLVADASGVLREPFPTLGAVRVGTPGRRRRRRNAIKRRRASLPLRRRIGVQSRAGCSPRARDHLARVTLHASGRMIRTG
jgi:Family of unknown function (DUF6101)